MAIYVWCELVCDNCATTTAGQFTSGTIPRRNMKKQAKDNAGWRFDDSGGMLCKKCSIKQKETD